MNSAQPSSAQRSVRDELVHAAVALLDEHGPDALQARKVAAAAGTSTMAVYTYFGGMQALITEVTREGLHQFDLAQRIPTTADPVADLLRCGLAYRRFATEHPHLYRLMFGSTSAHGINVPSANVLALDVADIDANHPSLAHLVGSVQRCLRAGRIAGDADDDATVLAIAGQFWAMMHGFVMLELAGFFGNDGAALGSVLGGLAGNNLLALGDRPEALQVSAAAVAAELL